MKNSLVVFILLIILLFCQPSYAKPNIVVSITSIASIVSMLTKDSANIVVLDTNSGCPHHHHAKPSDKLTIKNAQMVIYIDDNFDQLVSSMLDNYNGKKIKLSDFKSIDFNGTNESVNWHFWLDLENVKAIQLEISKLLVDAFPELKTQVEKNLLNSIDKINDLALVKNRLDIPPTALLSDSVEHFFKSLKHNQITSLNTINTSLKNMQILDNLLKSDKIKCIILSDDQNAESYKKYGKIIIQINSENWVVQNNEVNLDNLFVDQYTKMIHQVSLCK